MEVKSFNLSANSGLYNKVNTFNKNINSSLVPNFFKNILDNCYAMGNRLSCFSKGNESPSQSQQTSQEYVFSTPIRTRQLSYDDDEDGEAETQVDEDGEAETQVDEDNIMLLGGMIKKYKKKNRTLRKSLRRFKKRKNNTKRRKN